MQKDRELWGKYVYNMSAFYFGLLSHLIGASARSKYDYDIEDAFILADVASLFKRQSLLEIDSHSKSKSQHTFFIDGVIRAEGF